ncbi:MAG TPA: aminoacyl-tRNA hydrolase [Candidatus Fraserbacteria bacterium]|nr:aminoacyl-tRNA hydrolase [Candidatus Fraserbacteria bacterium]
MVGVVCGLGNPGPRYVFTRHNLGFRALDAYLERYGGRARLLKSPEALYYRLDGHLLVKPLTYMNRSGLAVRQFCLAQRCTPQDCLIVYDDYALPLGRLRARAHGSSGGHQGMRSVIEALGTQEIPRLRLGIRGAGPTNDLVEYVLAPFTPKEEELLPDLLARAAEAIELFLHRGIEAVMQEFNPEA